MDVVAEDTEEPETPHSVLNRSDDDFDNKLTCGPTTDAESENGTNFTEQRNQKKREYQDMIDFVQKNWHPIMVYSPIHENLNTESHSPFQRNPSISSKKHKDDEEYSGCEIVDLELFREQPRRSERLIQEQNKVTIHLEENKYHHKSGTTINADIVGFISETETFVVKDRQDNQMLIVHSRMLDCEQSLLQLQQHFLYPITDRHFKFPIGSEVVYTFGPDIYTPNYEECLSGETTPARVLYHIRDDDNRKWYVVFLPEHDEPSDENNWWSAYDVIREHQLCD